MTSDRPAHLVKGYAQVYTGNCKGKTTAALGLAFRAMGSGFKTYIGQFMKGQQYGELESARMVKPFITIEQYGRKDLIHVQDPPLPEDVQMAMDGLVKARRAMMSGDYDIIIFDEILTAHCFHLVSVDSILDLVKTRPDKVEIVLTGRHAPQEVIDAVDLVTEMVEVKHYFTKGVGARKGIEL
ncbi:MAG: cob(I)yrinic acid a,c-diamide adenosyltransferase [Dehalococcoidia bacterium]|nr:MAG: cob(I)yrinic acid a,c-diamide adenosyltransferase [Dehalococcoidia bacterium]